MEGPPLGPGGEDITWPDQVAPRGRKASSTRKIKPQTSSLKDIESRSETIPTTIHGEARGETTHILIGDNNEERDVETAVVRATAIQGMEQLTSITQGASQRKDETSAITSIGHNSQPMAKGGTGNQAVNSEKEIDPQLTTSAANTALNEGEAVALVTQHTPLGPKGDNQQVC